MVTGAHDPGDDRRPSAQDAKREPHDLPLFDMLGKVDPAIRRMFEDFLNYTIFAERPLALDLKTRYLVLVGITTAVRGDREGIEWSSQLAMKHGASEREVLEAISLSHLPAGTPSIEYAAAVWDQMREGAATVQARGTDEGGRGFSAWDGWSR
jgi:alkylhydroperoxidase/carboxymuconolactone decarboxylase family protein YurZ